MLMFLFSVNSNLNIWEFLTGEIYEIWVTHLISSYYDFLFACKRKKRDSKERGIKYIILEILSLCILSNNDLLEGISAWFYERLLLNYRMLKCHGQLKRRSKRIRAIAIQLLLAEK
jgi:NADH:ubiquinone oxidoreductase subunit 2 (subunit N)